jgi:hypothetical protein
MKPITHSPIIPEVIRRSWDQKQPSQNRDEGDKRIDGQRKHGRSTCPTAFCNRACGETSSSNRVIQSSLCWRVHKEPDFCCHQTASSNLLCADVFTRSRIFVAMASQDVDLSFTKDAMVKTPNTDGPSEIDPLMEDHIFIEDVKAALDTEEGRKSIFQHLDVDGTGTLSKSEFGICEKDGDSDDDVLDGSKLHAGELMQWNSQLLRFFKYPNSSIRDASQYSAIANELMALMLITCWILTCIFTPSVIWDNELLKAWGYNNVCVGLDAPPALYVAAASYPFVAWASITFVKQTVHRIAAEARAGKILVGHKCVTILLIAAHLSYLLGTAIFVLCFVTGPHEDLYGHTMPFLFYMITKYVSTVALVIETTMETDPRMKKVVRPQTWTFMVISGLLTFSFAILTFFTYDHYEACLKSGAKSCEPFAPWWISAILDWSWFITQAIQGSFLPFHPMLINGKWIHKETIGKVRELLCKNPATLSSHPAGFAGFTAQIFGSLGMANDRDVAMSSLRLRKFANKLRTPHHVIRISEESVTPSETQSVAKLVEKYKEMGRSVTALVPQHPNLLRGITITVARGELKIDNRINFLNEIVRGGLFEKPGIYPAICRVNVSESGVARMSIRVNVPPEMALLEEAETTGQIDFLLAENLKEFHVPTTTSLAAALTRKHRFGRKEPYKIDNTVGVLGKSYYGALPFKAGEGAVKWGLKAKREHPLSLKERPGVKNVQSLAGQESDCAALYAKSMLAALQSGRDSTEWDFVVQAASVPMHTVEVGNAQWHESFAADYIPVGSFQLSSVAAEGAKQDACCDGLFFSPWNQLKAHRPLGPLNRARYMVYKAHREACDMHKVPQPDLVCPFFASLDARKNSPSENPSEEGESEDRTDDVESALPAVVGVESGSTAT